MTVKQSVITALRLSAAAAAALDGEIDRYISTARAEMIRVGVDSAAAAGTGELVTEAIVTYCCMKMGAPDRYDQYKAAWEYQINNLRRSTLTENGE